MNLPSSDTTALPQIMSETNLELIAEFARSQGAVPNEQMLTILLSSSAIQVIVAKLDGAIVAMRVYMAVVNPLRSTRGWALVDEYGDCVGLEPQLE